MIHVCVCFYIYLMCISDFFICRKEKCIQVLPHRTIPENGFALGFNVRAGTCNISKNMKVFKKQLVKI